MKIDKDTEFDVTYTYSIASLPDWHCAVHGKVFEGDKWEQPYSFYGKAWCPRCVNEFLAQHCNELAKKTKSDE